MIVSARDAGQIVARRKTELRIPVAIHPVSGKPESRCRYKPGNVYRLEVSREWTVQRLERHRRSIHEPTRARSVLAYLDGPLDAQIPPGREVTMVDVRRERLGELTRQGAAREGYRFLAQFWEAWEAAHGSADPERPVWVLSFVVDDRSDRFDTPRLLAARPGPGHDYVAESWRAMPDEPEAVDAATQERISEAGTGRWMQEVARREAERASQRLSERLRVLEERERAGHAVPELRVIREKLRKFKAA